MYVRMKYKNFTILHVAIQGARVDEECSIVRGRGEFLETLLTILPELCLSHGNINESIR